MTTVTIKHHTNVSSITFIYIIQYKEIIHMFSIYSQTFSVPDLTEERIKKEAKRHVIAPKTNKQNDNKPKINRNVDEN